MTFEGHNGNITAVAFHCEGKWMVTSSEDCTVKVWDTRTGNQQRNYTHSHPVNDVVIHPNQGELVSADGGGSIRIWDLGESRCTHQLIPEDDISASSVSVASDGTLLAAGNNNVGAICSICTRPPLEMLSVLLTAPPGQRVHLAHGAER